LGFLRSPPSWRLGRKLRADGAAARLAPGFAAAAGAADADLVLWRWCDRPPHKVAVLDPSGRLPKNRLSWA
jgi:RES domain-containing protein